MFSFQPNDTKFDYDQSTQILSERHGLRSLRYPASEDATKYFCGVSSVSRRTDNL
jgi:hypothetical protein